MSRARDVVAVAAAALVDHPDDVQVVERIDRGQVRIDVTARAGDLGQLIGRRGRTASAVRALADLAAADDAVRPTVDFLDAVE